MLNEFKTFNEIAPTGYALGFHIEYTKATYMFEAYPKDWIKHYAENGMLLSDPTVVWGFQNEGQITWSELKKNDEAGVLKKAGDFGLNFGSTFSMSSGELKTIGSFSHPDRNFALEEIEILSQGMKRVMDQTVKRDPLPKAMIDELSELGISVFQNLD